LTAEFQRPVINEAALHRTADFCPKANRIDRIPTLKWRQSLLEAKMLKFP